jgi:hypothetical protein
MLCLRNGPSKAVLRDAVFFDIFLVDYPHFFGRVPSTRKFIGEEMYPWRRSLVVSSLPATEETGAVGREIEPHHGIGWYF